MRQDTRQIATLPTCSSIGRKKSSHDVPRLPVDKSRLFAFPVTWVLAPHDYVAMPAPSLE